MYRFDLTKCLRGAEIDALPKHTCRGLLMQTRTRIMDKELKIRIKSFRFYQIPKAKISSVSHQAEIYAPVSFFRMPFGSEFFDC